MTKQPRVTSVRVKQKGDPFYHTVFTTGNQFKDYKDELKNIKEILLKDDEKTIASIKPIFEQGDDDYSFKTNVGRKGFWLGEMECLPTNISLSASIIVKIVYKDGTKSTSLALLLYEI